jgi:hypothetical protein
VTTHELVERLRDAGLNLGHVAMNEDPWNPKIPPEQAVFFQAASRLSEMEAEIKRLREIESFAQTAARWSNPERRHPHTIVSADEMLKAIWGHPSRAALEHQP